MATRTSMNPRQRRGVLLLVVAALGAIGVFAAVASYVADVRSQVEPYADVVRLTEDVGAYDPLDASVEVAEVPERWISETAVSDPNSLVGQVASADLAAGSVLQDGMMVPDPELEAGQRELAILVDAETGVAGKVGPGTIVDIQATFAGGTDEPAVAQTVVVGARVIDVGVQTTAPGDAPNEEEEDVVPVTFALSSEEARIVAYAESFASEVRLALVGPNGSGQGTRVGIDDREYRLGEPGAESGGSDDGGGSDGGGG